jgi:hypothetical protein
MVCPVFRIKQLTPEQFEYLDACARIRNISTSRLCSRLLTTIADNQMVLAVLDDDSRPRREKRQRQWRARRMQDV